MDPPLAPGADEPLDAGEADADGSSAATEAEGWTVGAGVGRRPTGSGPTRMNAARTPAATRRPARIVTPVFMRRESTSTGGRGRRDRRAARIAVRSVRAACSDDRAPAPRP